MKKIIVVGSGISSLSSACYLAKNGYDVTVVEKNNQLGGRITIWKSEGFTFDMGPSWYWMKDVFDSFYSDFGYNIEDFYELIKLDPGFRMIFDSEKKDYLDLKSDLNEVYKMFQEEELDYDDDNGAVKLRELMKDGQYTYENAVGEYMQKISNSILEYMDPYLIQTFIKGGLLKSYGKQIEDKFKNPKIRKLLDFPVLFLGATSKNTPYLYNMMAYTMIEGGTYYPIGGMIKITESLVKLGSHLGVKFILNAEVKEVELKGSKIRKVIVYDKGANTEEETGFEYTSIEHKSQIEQARREKNIFLTQNDIEGANIIQLKEFTDQNSITGIYELDADYVVCGGDYHHFEQSILPKSHRVYTEKYWDKQVLAPSGLIAYVGLNMKVDNLTHHNLFFEPDLEEHGNEIYTNPKWPNNPLFYLCVPSKTDETVAPEGCENLFFLMPVAPNLDDSQEEKEKYFDLMIERLEKFTGNKNIKDNIIVKRLYSVKDFKNDYFSYKGNAYGHANTLNQTAVFKPKMLSKKIKNLVYCGQLTVPGPGIPPSIISGKIAANWIINKK